MPLRFEIDTALGLVLTRAEGRVTGEDLFAHAAALAAVPDRPTRELVDFSDRSEVTVPVQAVRRTGDLLRATDVSLPGSKVAMVARADALFGMLRLYQAHRDHEAVEIRVFRDREEALRWLGISAAPGVRESQLTSST